MDSIDIHSVALSEKKDSFLWKITPKQCDIHVRRIRIHDFRHSHASCLIANGINIVAVSKRLGHSDVNMTLKIYTHLIKKNEDELLLYVDNPSQKLLT